MERLWKKFQLYREMFINGMNVADIYNCFVYVRGIALNELTLVRIATTSRIKKDFEGYALPIMSKARVESGWA